MALPIVTARVSEGAIPLEIALCTGRNLIQCEPNEQRSHFPLSPTGKGHWIIDTPIANPMSYYENYKASRTSWGINAMGRLNDQLYLSGYLVAVDFH